MDKVPQNVWWNSIYHVETTSIHKIPEYRFSSTSNVCNLSFLSSFHMFHDNFMLFLKIRKENRTRAWKKVQTPSSKKYFPESPYSCSQIFQNHHTRIFFFLPVSPKNQFSVIKCLELLHKCFFNTTIHQTCGNDDPIFILWQRARCTY